MAGLKELGGDVEGALERVRVPAYVIDRNGIIRWLNPAAERIVGDVRGRQMTSVLAPEERRRGRETFTRNLSGPPGGLGQSGRLLGGRRKRLTMEVSGVPLERGGHVIGVFGQVKEVDKSEPPPPPHPNLTPRQGEVLRLLEQGHSTDQIASELHVSVATVRNHIGAIFRTAPRPLAPRGRRARAPRRPSRRLTQREPVLVRTLTLVRVPGSSPTERTEG